MAELKPYDPSKPWFSVNLPTKEELIAATLGLIPGYRALKNFHDNPEGPISETLDLAAEDFVPLYGSLIKPVINGDDIDTEQALKEAAIFGIPMPYTRFPKGHPKAGEAIPNNLKEGLGNLGYNTAKYKLKKGTRKLYADPNARRTMYTGGNTEGGISTRSRVDATNDAREAIEVPAGPYQATNTGSDIINHGQQAVNNNTITRTGHIQGAFNGARGWQGDMYPPGRRLANTEEGLAFALEKLDPAQHEYVRKLNDVINENEYKWEYLINKTRPTYNGKGVISKQDIADIAIAQGRPDIAERVMRDDKPRMTTNPGYPNYDKRFNSYYANQKGELKDNAKWKDVGNRQVEKELREQYSVLPDDIEIRQKFAEIYGVPDLYHSWMNDPLLWAKYKNDTQTNRYFREASNRKYRRNTGWKNPNK